MSSSVQAIASHDAFQTTIPTTGLAVVNFYADWCGPCKILTPQIERLSKEFADVRFFKVDMDQVQETGAERGISTIPTFLFFRDGKQLERKVVGANFYALKTAVEELRG